MPSRHRAAASSLVTVRPANRISPAPGARSPEMRPKRLVLPAPFGPTIPTTSPAPTASDRSSAMTTRPNRFVTRSSSSSGPVMLCFPARLGAPLRHRLPSSLAPPSLAPQSRRRRAPSARSCASRSPPGPPPPHSRLTALRLGHPLRVGRLEVGGDLGLRLQGVVDDLHLQRVLGALLPL